MPTWSLEDASGRLHFPVLTEGVLAPWASELGGWVIKPPPIACGRLGLLASWSLGITAGHLPFPVPPEIVLGSWASGLAWLRDSATAIM